MLIFALSALSLAHADQAPIDTGFACTDASLQLTVPTDGADALPLDLKPHLRFTSDCTNGAIRVTLSDPSGPVFEQELDLLLEGLAQDLDIPQLSPVQNYTLSVHEGAREVTSIAFRTGLSLAEEAPPTPPSLTIDDLWGWDTGIDLEATILTSSPHGFVLFGPEGSDEPGFAVASIDGIQAFGSFSADSMGEVCFTAVHRDAAGRLSAPSEPTCATPQHDQVLRCGNACSTSPSMPVFGALAGLLLLARKR